MPVAGEVLIRRILRDLRGAGVRRVVVNLHHRAETVTAHLGDGRDLGLEVRYSWEDPVLGSAGGPRRARSLVDADRFLVVNGDTLTDLDVTAVVREHVRSDALVTMAVAPGDTARYGGVSVDSSGAVAGFVGRSTAASVAPGTVPDAPAFHFIGVQAVEARAFDEAPEDAPSETVRWLYPRLIAARAGSVRAHVSAAAFLDIGTPRDYFETASLIASREGRPLDRGVDVDISPSARIERSILWDRVRVGAHATLTDCIVADDVVIPAGARYQRKVIAALGDEVRTVDF